MDQTHPKPENEKSPYFSLNICPGDICEYTWQKPDGKLLFLVISVEPKQLSCYQLGPPSAGLTTFFTFKLEDLASKDRIRKLITTRT